ncbi:hypothetical protein ACTXT7_011148 [Hymenolepis weldensis]
MSFPDELRQALPMNISSRVNIKLKVIDTFGLNSNKLRGIHVAITNTNSFQTTRYFINIPARRKVIPSFTIEFRRRGPNWFSLRFRKEPDKYSPIGLPSHTALPLQCLLNHEGSAEYVAKISEDFKQIS